MKLKIQKAGAGCRAGYTIAEVLMAMVIVGISAGGLMYSLGYALQAMEMARENQRATQILLEKAEAIRLCSWDNVTTAGFIPATFTDHYDPTAAYGSMGTAYSGTVSVGAVPFNNSYSANLRQVTISLQWQTKDTLRSRTVVTYIAKDGIQNYVF